MFERLLKLYVMAIAGDVRSPMPHLVGPPGTGKSTILAQLAAHVGHKLHTLNVSRLSPLEVEGVQMPVSDKDSAMKLMLLHATTWTQLKPGDILFLDEFLRGMPEVYNALLDILTAREVAGFELPPVFIIGASNSTTAYDPALDDRLLHIPVPDPRPGKPGHKRIAKEIATMIVEHLGLNPKMIDSSEMQHLLDTQVIPMYNVMDQMMGGAGLGIGSISSKGKSIRNLIGQAKLREVETLELNELITMNNLHSSQAKQFQYVLLLDGKNVPAGYENAANRIQKDKLNEAQLLNLNLNQQLIQMERLRVTKGVHDDDDTFNVTNESN